MSAPVRLGWSVRDITPSLPVALRGQFPLRIATRIHDPLTLTALAVESGGEAVVFVSFDGCAVDDEILEQVREALPSRLPELDPRKIIACGTHTHTAPFAGQRLGLQRDEDHIEALRERYPDYVTMDSYGAQLAGAFVDAVCEAWEQMEPGQLAWGYSHAVVGENRRVRYFDNHAAMYGSTATPDFSHIEGHVDHGVQMLFTYDEAGTVTGAVINVPCPSQVSEGGWDYVSADYWHDVRLELRRRHGDALHVLPQCSAAGDQSPHRLINAAAEDRMLALKYGIPADPPLNTSLRLDIARRIADAFDDAEPVARRDLRPAVTLKHEYQTLDLPHWDLSEAEYASLQSQIADLTNQISALGDADPLGAESTSLHCMREWCRRAAARYENHPASLPAEMNVARLGDVAFVTAPFEFYLDFGDRIKGRSAAVQTFIVQLTGGGAYLPTERAAEGLSYGAVPASCQVSPAGGQVLVDAAVATISEQFADS